MELLKWRRDAPGATLSKGSTTWLAAKAPVDSGDLLTSAGCFFPMDVMHRLTAKLYSVFRWRRATRG